jgi:hypothetical protein
MTGRRRRRPRSSRGEAARAFLCGSQISLSRFTIGFAQAEATPADATMALNQNIAVSDTCRPIVANPPFAPRALRSAAAEERRRRDTSTDTSV